MAHAGDGRGIDPLDSARRWDSKRPAGESSLWLVCYLEGTAVEIMGGSDNVLRGGLTPKHVDVPELLRVLDFGAGPVPIRRAVPVSQHELRYDAPTPDFALSRLELPAGARWSAPVAGPELLLCVEGRVRVDAEPGLALALEPGQSAFVRATTAARTVTAEREATLHRATVGAPMIATGSGSAGPTKK